MNAERRDRARVASGLLAEAVDKLIAAMHAETPDALPPDVRGKIAWTAERTADARDDAASACLSRSIDHRSERDRRGGRSALVVSARLLAGKAMLNLARVLSEAGEKLSHGALRLLADACLLIVRAEAELEPACLPAHAQGPARERERHC